MTTRQTKPLQGAALLALSALLFALMGVGIREVSSGVNNESVVFFRNLVGVLFFLPLIALKGLRPLKTTRLKSHLWRTTYGLAAMYCFFYAIAHLPLADAML
ncbi:MAG TPA: EamA family transporter, partial [Pseudomonas sp.]|nr:EamA family transporter [Pseudomonas sp.]